MFNLNDKLALSALIVLGVSVATLAGAWTFQLYGGLAPCPMCLQQRWAYYAAVILCVFILMARRSGGSAPRIALAVCGMAILAGGVLAAYHAGVEWKWWEGPTTCTGTGGFSSETSALPDLSKPPLVPCDEAAWRLFGLSLAGYNVLISAALAGLCFWGVRNSKKTQ